MAIENDHLLGPLEKEHRKRLVLYGGIRGISTSLELPGIITLKSGRKTRKWNKNKLTFCFKFVFVGLLQGSTAPVNIPGSSLGNFSPTNHSSLFNVSDPFNHSHISGSAPKINNSFGHSESLFLSHSSHLISPLNDGGLSISPDLR